MARNSSAHLATWTDQDGSLHRSQDMLMSYICLATRPKPHKTQTTSVGPFVGLKFDDSIFDTQSFWWSKCYSVVPTCFDSLCVSQSRNVNKWEQSDQSRLQSPLSTNQKGYPNPNTFHVLTVTNTTRDPKTDQLQSLRCRVRLWWNIVHPRLTETNLVHSQSHNWIRTTHDLHNYRLLYTSYYYVINIIAGIIF